MVMAPQSTSASSSGGPHLRRDAIAPARTPRAVNRGGRLPSAGEPRGGGADARAESRVRGVRDEEPLWAGAVLAHVLEDAAAGHLRGENDLRLTSTAASDTPRQSRAISRHLRDAVELCLAHVVADNERVLSSELQHNLYSPTTPVSRQLAHPRARRREAVPPG